MDKCWIDLPNRMSKEYMDGINQFMEFTNGFDNEFISYPCRKCANRYYYRREFVRGYLILNGFLKQYKNWIKHGEEYVSCRREERDEIEVELRAELRAELTELEARLSQSRGPIASNPPPTTQAPDAGSGHRARHDSVGEGSHDPSGSGDPDQVLRLLVKIYQRLPSPDYLSICQCLMFLDEPEGGANILEKLLQSGSKDDALLAFQIAFDLIENEHQAFLLNVRNRLPDSKSQAASRINLEQPSESVEHETSGIDSAQNGNAVAGSANVAGSVEDVQMTDGAHAPNGAVQEMNPNEVAYAEKLAKIKGILSGETSIRLTLQFLYSHHRSDLLILKTIKQSVEMRNSVWHSATIHANAIMHAGTTVDTFLRENLSYKLG